MNGKGKAASRRDHLLGLQCRYLEDQLTTRNARHGMLGHDNGLSCVDLERQRNAVVLQATDYIRVRGAANGTPRHEYRSFTLFVDAIDGRLPARLADGRAFGEHQGNAFRVDVVQLLARNTEPLGKGTGDHVVGWRHNLPELPASIVRKANERVYEFCGGRRASRAGRSKHHRPVLCKPSLRSSQVAGTPWRKVPEPLCDQDLVLDLGALFVMRGRMKGCFERDRGCV